MKMINQDQEELDRHYRNTVPDLNEALITLSQCDCCVIHQENKPTSTHKLQKKEYRICHANPIDTPKRKFTCKCSCRHMARKLTRAHLYSMYEHEQDNRMILHEVFMHTHEEIKREIAKLAELKKRKKQKLKQMNLVYKEEDYFLKYKEYECEYYQILSEIEEQENTFHVCEERDYHTRQMLENHIHDFPDIQNELDPIFMDMFVYPGYEIMYDTDVADSEINISDSDIDME